MHKFKKKEGRCQICFVKKKVRCDEQISTFFSTCSTNILSPPAAAPGEGESFCWEKGRGAVVSVLNAKGTLKQTSEKYLLD